MTNDVVTYTDPWSRRLITEESVTNRNCKHTYDKATVMKFLDKANKDKKTLECPNVGCNQKNPITKDCLYTDLEIQRKVARQKGRR